MRRGDATLRVALQINPYGNASGVKALTRGTVPDRAAPRRAMPCRPDVEEPLDSRQWR